MEHDEQHPVLSDSERDADPEVTALIKQLRASVDNMEEEFASWEAEKLASGPPPGTRPGSEAEREWFERFMHAHLTILKVSMDRLFASDAEVGA